MLINIKSFTLVLFKLFYNNLQFVDKYGNIWVRTTQYNKSTVWNSQLTNNISITDYFGYCFVLISIGLREKPEVPDVFGHRSIYNTFNVTSLPSLELVDVSWLLQTFETLRRITVPRHNKLSDMSDHCFPFPDMIIGRKGPVVLWNAVNFAMF
jgi:hypothetical protein